jgi:uncharacterized membrane protein
MFQLNGGRARRGTLVVGVRSILKQVGRDEVVNRMYLGRLAGGVLLLVSLSEMSTVSGDDLSAAARWLHSELEGKKMARSLFLLVATGVSATPRRTTRKLRGAGTPGFSLINK